jgi:cytochrome b561
MLRSSSAPAEPFVRPARYPAAFRALHWISAAVILWATVSGFWAATLAEGSAAREAISGFNVALTALFIPVFGVRMAMRPWIVTPEPVAGSQAQRAAARLAHGGLYVLTTIVLVTGLLSAGPTVDIFGLVDVHMTGLTQADRIEARHIHALSCRALAVLVTLHILAVITHQRAGTDVLARMRAAKRR